MMTGSRAQRVPALLACLLAALATAALAHAAIDLLGRLGVGADADAYATHAHGAVAPVVLAAAALLAGLLLCAALRAAARSAGGDPFIALTKRLAGADPCLPICAVAAGGFAALIGMEFVEQLAAFGHADLAAALGGSPLLGASAVTVTAILVTVIGARCARALVAAAIVTSHVIAALFIGVVRCAGLGDAAARRLVHAPVRISAGVLLARRRPSRASPASH